MQNLVTLLPFLFELLSKNHRGPKWPPPGRRLKFKYIDFESWATTWLHKGNMIVEDQLAYNLMPKPDRTTQGRILRRSAKCEQKLEMILFLAAPDTNKQVYWNLIGWGHR